MEQAPVSGIDRIAGLDWDGIEGLWQRIVTGAAPGSPGKAFEEVILRAFELSGATVRRPYAVTLRHHVIEQIDGSVHLDGLSALVECKDSNEPVNVEPIAKLRNQLMRRHGGTIGMLFSRSDYTEPAQILAQFLAPQMILLWEGIEIDTAIRRRDFRAPLTTKFRWCVETGAPDFNTALEIAR